MVNILKFCCLIMISSTAYSQSLHITVSDLDTGSLLEGANIIATRDADSKEFGGATDSDGFLLFALDPGAYDIEISYIGYDVQLIKQVIISDKKASYLKCALSVLSVPIKEHSIIGDAYGAYKTMPGAVSVVSESKIKQISPIGTQELLEHVPGISAFSDDGIGNSRISVGVRGLNPRRSSRVLILEDGVPIQPALYVYPNMYYNPPVERIDGVEIIKGSGVIKYGPQTMGGVINYTTRKPSQQFGAFTDLTVGNNGYKSSFIEINGLGTKNMKSAMQFLYKAGDGFRQNNGFEQFNGTLKTVYSVSDKRNLYSKIGFNYENSNATYTGLTEYSFQDDPTFNPKEHDNFKIFRSSFDLIDIYKINSNVIRERKLFLSFFDRRWWRENDVFTSASNTDLAEVALSSSGSLQYLDDIIRVGNGEDNFGILRTFYVAGLEQLYNIDHKFLGLELETELGSRLYWEKFIDNKQTGNSPDAREGIYYYDAEEFTDENDNYSYDFGESFTDLNGNNVYDETETIVGQSHHYETLALASFVSSSVHVNKALTLNGGLRLELFEQERIDLLDGASYLDNTSFELLPSVSFLFKSSSFNVFGGVHRGMTSPSSGALKSTTFSLDSGLDLKSEKSWNKEIGIRTTFPSDRSNAELSFFHVNIKDMVAAGRGGQFGVFQNLGSVVSMGTELSLYLKSKLRFMPALYLSHTFLVSNVTEATLPGYSFMRGTSAYDISGNSVPYTPRNTLVVGLEQSVGSSFSLRLDFKYVDKVFTDFHNIDTNDYSSSSIGFGMLGIDGIVPAYHIFNLSAGFEPTSRLDIGLSIKNLMDEIYIGSLLHSNPGQRQANMSSGIIPGPRRQISLSIRYKIK